MEKVLVISPHCDDEMFGVGGTLMRHHQAGDSIAFLWFTQARNTFKGAERISEYFNAYHVFLNYKDQQLDTYPIIKLITPIETMIKSFLPTIVYIPFSHDLNKDHRLVSEAAMVACRPYKLDAPKEVWMYEIPGTTELGFRYFRGDKSVQIDGMWKNGLIHANYPSESINGREELSSWEHFERWPKL